MRKTAAEAAATAAEAATTAELAPGVVIPLIGLGTWPMTGEAAADAVARAIANGYRHIDTAENYGNEEAVGEGIRRSGIARGNLFLTTKFNRQWHGITGVRDAFTTAAYSPLGRGGSFLSASAVTGPAGEYGKTPAQVVLRWHVQSGRVAIPKSADDRRQRENLDVFGFSLTGAEMAAIDALETGAPPRLDSDEFGH
ncbi:aldo/keto reductase [Arthrobacter sp. NPDC057388]|uniref:aldo/keto reductase n=1 Tax=Arthrobacter sp. NPDC057388 TaxID=3346116 RepID=UPI003645F255